jgi:hypothetical protein
MFVDPGEWAIVVNEQFETQEVTPALRSNCCEGRFWHETLEWPFRHLSETKVARAKLSIQSGLGTH